MRCTTLLALLTGVVLYLVMGALVFRTLEASNEDLAYKQLLTTKDTFLKNKTCVNEREFYKLVKVTQGTLIPITISIISSIAIIVQTLCKLMALVPFLLHPS